ncbi:MAG TPA: MBL fold metallo-hydrolase [Candidatus Baltobacteraceae bacterium]|jgi:glyoxylase-like metal-dependent hydrolase (beta-lactamase superfamily II)
MALEDEFADILKKALRGTGTSVTSLARTIAIPADALHAWTAGTDRPTDEQARAVAAALHLDPGNLADAAAERWHPDPIALPDVRHHPQHPHPSNGYVFFVDGGRRAALVDPAGVPANLLRVLRDGPYHLEYILVTHKHADHCDATAEIAAAFPHAKIVMHRADAHAIGELAGRALPIKDGEELPFGDGVAVRMLHTPGHTDGSSSFVFRSTVFTGDTLFAGSIGGAYGDASTYADILKSVRTRLFTLPDETVVMPGHGPPTRIGWERAHNPFFPNESA